MNDINVLTKYGVTEQFYAEAASYPDLIIARVISQYNDLYKIVSSKGEMLAEVSGKFRHETLYASDYPAVGDFVMINNVDPLGGSAVIHTVLPRKSAFKRLAVGKTNEEQIIAANIDFVFICISLNSNYNLNRLERYLSAAWTSGARPVIVLTKSDVCDDLDDVLGEVASIAAGADIITTSNTDERTFEKLFRYLKEGVTGSFIGSSGVGKSTLINALIGEELIKTQAIRQDDKGRHTTTRKELIVLPAGGIVIDTPGMREFAVESVDLEKTFSDIDELIEKCKFKNCAHTVEPGCAVQGAIASGELDERRFASYQKLKKEAAYNGLSSKQIESMKLDAMFKHIGGQKNLRAYIKQKDKYK